MSDQPQDRPENVFDWGDGDEYTETPRYLRIYWEDNGDEYPWRIDGIDNAGRYTENVARYADLAGVIDALPEQVKMYSLEPEKEWHPMTLGQIRGWLSGSFGVGDYGTAEPQTVITEVRETEHGVEYR